MQNTSTLFKTKIKEASRQFQCRITIGDKIFTNEDIVDIKIDGNMQPQDGFMIGVTPSNMLDLTILNSGDTIYSTNQIKVEIGLNIGSTIEYILMGYYNIDDIVKTKYNIKITAFDNMIKFEIPYFSNLGDTATLQQVVNELANKTGVEFTGSLPAYNVKKLEGFTCREVLGYVASLCGGNAVITREGKFTIVTPKEVEYTITPDNYIPPFNLEEVKYKVGKISCKAGENELVKGSLGVDSMELQFENPWVTESILQDIYNKLNGFNYLGYSMKWQGDISLDLGDIVTITDKKGVVRKHPILSQKFNYTGGLTVEMGAKGESKNKNSFNSSGSSSNKINRMVTELLIVNEALINKANISDLKATNAEIANLKAQDAEIQNALIGKATIEQLNAVNANIKNLVAEDAKINNALINKADIVQLNAVSAKIKVLEADSASIKDLVAGNISAGNIQSEFLQTLQGWMLEGSIGNAQISDLDVNKINAGDIDTSKLRIVSKDGEIQIEGYQILINDTTNPLNKVNRVLLGKYKKADNTYEYGLVIRGKDGNTVMWDADGVHNAGITDGAVDNNKISDTANISGNKLDINSVIRSVNGATEKIESTVVQVGNKTLNVLLQEQNNTITEQGKTLESHSARITANENSINLKVDTQTYSQDKTTINNSITTTLRDSKAYADTKKSEAISTAATDATTKANGAKDTAIAEAQKKADKALADSKVYVNQEITTVNSNLSKATSDISVLKGQIALKVEQSDIDKTVTTVKNELVTKIDGIEVGGRNLLLNTSTDEKEVTFSGWDKYFPDRLTDFKVGENLTGRVYLKPLSYEASCMLHINYTDGTYSQYRGNVIQSGKEGYSQVTITIPSEKPVSYIQFSIRHSSKETPSNIVKYKQAKVEKGNKPTDWTPAPEDVEETIADVITTTDTKISQAKADIKIETDKIALNVSNLTTKTTTIETQLGDKATKAEVKTVSDKAATIEANLNGITQRVSSTESKVTTVETTANQANSKIDNLEVGGTNLVLASKEEFTLEPKNSGAASDNYNYKQYTLSENLKDRQDCTVSFDATITAGTFSRITMLLSDGTSSTAAYAVLRGNRWVGQINSAATHKYIYIYAGEAGSTRGNGMKLSKVKLEKGNKATDWTPAPEDINKDISQAKTDAISTASSDATTKASNALKDGKAYTDNGLVPVNKTLATHTTEISTTKQQVSTIETNLGSITTRVSTVENKTTTIDGKVAAQETRISTAEQKITPTSIVNSVSSGISNGTALDITSIKLEKNLFTVKNSMFKLYDTYGDLALSSGNGWTYAQGGLQAAVAPHNKPTVRGITLSSGNAGLKPYGITHESFNNLPFIIGSNNLKVDIRNMIDTEWGNIEANAIYGDGLYSNHAVGSYTQIIRDEVNSRGGDGILWLNYKTDSVSSTQVVVGAGDMGNWGKISANSLYVKGSKNCIQDTEHYGYRAINAYETASYYFGDIGEGTIGKDGLCYISIDDVFMEVINTKCKYEVFLQKYGQGDVWVKERTENYFILEGTPGLLFGWELKAKRKGFETDRLEIVELTPEVSMDFRLNKEDEETLNMDKRTNETLTIMNNGVKEEIKEQRSILNSMDEEVRQEEMEREEILGEW